MNWKHVLLALLIMAQLLTLIMALLPQVYILVVILMQIWEAPDLSVV